MTNDEKIRDENLQHNFNREAEKMLALLSGKTDNYILQAKIYYFLVQVI